MTNDMIAALLRSNMSEDRKRDFLRSYFVEQVTPQPIKELLHQEDIAAKLAAHIHGGNSKVEELIIDVLITYGRL